MSLCIFMANIFVVPGYQEDALSYSIFQEAVKNSGFTYKAVLVPWNISDIKDWVDSVRGYLKENLHEGDIVFGFSIGAFVLSLIPYFYRDDVPMVLGSISPLFKENIEMLGRDTFSFLGDKNISQLEDISYGDVVASFRKRKVVVWGEQEDVVIKEVSQRISSLCSVCNGMSIEHTIHDCNTRTYAEGVIKAVHSLREI